MIPEAATLKARLIVWGIALAVLVALVLGYGEWRAHNARTAEAQKWELAVTKLKAEASKQLAAETKWALNLERELLKATQELEAMNAKRREETRAAERRLADAVRAGGGRLRDPNAGRGCGGGGAQAQAAGRAGPGEGDGAEAGGVLSAELTGLLQRLTREADDINDAYAVCRPDAMNARKINEGTEGK
jgi:hypothetical protein